MAVTKRRLHPAASSGTVSAAPLATRASAAPLTLARDLLALARPRITLMVALTAAPAFKLGHGVWPAASTLVGVLLGIGLVGAGCSAINAWYERDRDALMPRTQDRPLPAGRIAPGEALSFGLLVSAAGVLALFVWGGGLAALVGALTLAYYIGVYTMWSKPRSAYSTVVGAVAGAAAPLIADAAVDGRIGLWGWALFGIVFVWQPPHVWAIALFRKSEYAAAGIPMMPAIVGERGTRLRMFGWALVLVPVTLLPLLGGVFGPVYAVTALAAGAMFVGAIALAIRAEDARADRRVFFASLLYVAVLFGEMLAELALG